MKRFMVVRHPTSAGAISAQLVIHSHLHEYHWESLDSEYVLCLASYSGHSHEILDTHPHVLVLPSVLSSVALHAHAVSKDRHGHFLSLKQALGLNESHRTADLAQMAAERYGRKFHLEL